MRWPCTSKRMFYVREYQQQGAEMQHVGTAITFCDLNGALIIFADF